MAHEDTEHTEISTCYEIDMLYSCDVYAITHTCTHIDQSCSPSLWQRLGLPDLHSSRYVYRQRGDEITPSASLCSISSVLSSACSLPLGQTQTHTHTHRSGWRNDYDFLASLSCRQEWQCRQQAKCVWWISEYGESANAVFFCPTSSPTVLYLYVK